MKNTKKNIKKFLNSEEGRILNSDVVKLGTTLGIVGAALSDADTLAVAGSTNQHQNYFGYAGGSTTISHRNTYLTIFGLNLHFNVSSSVPKNSHYSHVAHNSHSSHSSHSSHGSHGSHARGGWC
ncbi:MAG: hypothetical protein K5838_07270 [Elusimicrobiales bacterium]|nr:hypothetical protein [Elusimicrobiales bacterium]